MCVCVCVCVSKAQKNIQRENRINLIVSVHTIIFIWPHRLIQTLMRTYIDTHMRKDKSYHTDSNSSCSCHRLHMVTHRHAHTYIDTHMKGQIISYRFELFVFMPSSAYGHSHIHAHVHAYAYTWTNNITPIRIVCAHAIVTHTHTCTHTCIGIHMGK